MSAKRQPASSEETLSEYIGSLLDSAPPGPADADTSDAQRPLIPEWGHASFRCRLVGVDGLTLAIPLEPIAGTMEWQCDVENDSNVPILDSFTGPEGSPLTIIDLARIVLPRDKWLPARQSGQESRYPLVLLTGNHFALRVDRLGKETVIQSDSVTWRTAETRRPWLAGTHKDLACAILDVDALLALMQ